MSLDDADKFFKERAGKEKQFAIFLEPEEAINTAKKMIDLIGDDAGIQIPFKADGAINEDGIAVSKEEAKKYIDKYCDVKAGVYRRCLDFYEGGRTDEEGIGRSLWIETYCRVGEGANNGIDLLEWG